VHRTSASILTALLVVVALAATGCGSKSKSAATTQTTTQAAQTTTTTTTAAAATTTTTAAAATTTTTSTSAAAGAIAGFATSKNCQQLVSLSAKLGQALTGAGSGDMKAYSDYLNGLAASAPADIRPDFKVIADAYSKIIQALGGASLKAGQAPDAATLAKLAKLGQEINEPAVTKAGTDISNWVQKNCSHG
jgi:hypothetical protein